jgi:hypothetical protein
MKKIPLIIILIEVVSLSTRLEAQLIPLSSYLADLNNKTFKTVVVKAAPSPTKNNPRRIYGGTFALWSTTIDVGELLRIYPKDSVIHDLIGLLNDTTRDWCANVLLYQITRKLNMNAFTITTREDWIKPINKQTTETHRDDDFKAWKAYTTSSGK